MKTLVVTSLMAGALALAAGTASLPVEEKETVRKTLAFSRPSAAKTLRVDNIEGSIHITGYAGGEVQMVASRTARAESKEKLETARQEVQLKLSEKDNVVDVVVDAPYRCSGGGINYRGWRYYGYQVRYDFEIQAPADVRLLVRTVNDGEIRIEKVTGDYDVENVNGGVEMSEVSGSGRGYALNGKVRVNFSGNPRSDSYFGSLNGNVEVAFLPSLSADLRLKNFNGSIYSDFPVTYVPVANVAPEHRGGKFVYKSNQFFGVRVGGGGPEIKFDAFNGNIHILKREQ